MRNRFRVLYLDDKRSASQLLGSLLSEYDELEVLTETDPAIALERLADSGVDCVLSDLEMPGMNGLEFLEAVREEYPTLPFILFTASESEASVSAAFEAEATDYILKSTCLISCELVVHRITTAIERSRLESQLEQHQITSVVNRY